MANEPWHLSKGIPVSLIFAILMQTIALIWFVATLTADVGYNTTNISKLQVSTTALEATVRSQDVLLGRIDENIKHIIKRMDSGE